MKWSQNLGFDTAWFAEHHFTNYCLFQFGDMPLVERALGPLERIGLRPAVRALTEQAA